MSSTRIVAAALAAFLTGAWAVVQLRSDPETSLTDATAADAVPDQPSTTNRPVLTAAPENFGPVPELTDLDGWLQTDEDAFADVRGDVTILQFWTYSCYNCTNTIPHLQDIYAAHRDEGLEIIGVHAPEFEREKDPVGIQAAAERLGVTWPIALDTEKRNFRSWQGSRRFWPRTYVIDQNGDIRFDKIGEGKYAELEATVAYLLENGA
ncbi:MAG: redoxin domain-containing protein [Acidimicrobiales bacterium]|nr:redoxin domain-containing protein [Acidimicrobiales bacterium]